jgi:hypothetical protein
MLTETVDPVLVTSAVLWLAVPEPPAEHDPENGVDV